MCSLVRDTLLVYVTSADITSPDHPTYKKKTVRRVTVRQIPQITAAYTAAIVIRVVSPRVAATSVSTR